MALRLHTRPAAEATVVAETDDPRALWNELQRSQLTPSAVDLLPPGRVALLFEGGEAAVAHQVGRCPGAPQADRSVWDEAAALQQRAGGRVPFAWQECLLARPGAGLAFVAEPVEREWSPLAERVRAAFDPGRGARMTAARGTGILGALWAGDSFWWRRSSPRRPCRPSPRRRPRRAKAPPSGRWS